MTTLWDTTGSAVVKALAAERRQAGSVSSGLALTLVVVVDEAHVAEAEAAATRAAAQHPCRLLIVVRRRPDAQEPRLDAEVLIGGRLGPGEAVVMRMYGRLALHAESVVLPLLAPDAPVVTWWYGEPPHRIAHDPLGVFADRRITDCSLATDPMAALVQRADDYAPGDTELGWTRTTLWRALCASAMDSVRGEVTRVKVSGAAGHVTRALLAGWLARRLGLDVDVEDAEGTGLVAVEIEADDVTVTVTRGKSSGAVLSRTGQPDRTLPLPRRELGDLLAEELRRLDPDEPYSEALEAATGTSGLADRSHTRTHVWHDPTEAEAPDPALTVS
ncbi:MAG: Glucose-6-phosphate dehydrogenase subunit [Frankiales bacterium]|jgi:glucose-6-phosphate dehydrogenase assembly protein OpcA|nr:Glucose-6-phosphate dehydrogenase subunit [Frankiales bacterium]